jgi:hypothetical protein
MMFAPKKIFASSASIVETDSRYCGAMTRSLTIPVITAFHNV